MKLVTQEEAKNFYEEATKAYERLQSYRDHIEGEEDLDDRVNALNECFERVGDLWDELGLDDENWYLGDHIIDEALGECIRYWDTDIADQLSFCDELVELLGYPELTETTE